MPFDKKYDDIFKLAIKEPANQKGIDAYRLDEQLFDEGMLDRIYFEIETCDFIVANLSGKNANVFYELGYAHAIGKLCILITDDAKNIPFDLKHKRHIVYGTSISNLRNQMELNLDWAIKEITSKKEHPFLISLDTTGELEATDEYAKANLTMLFDIENKGRKTSPEIQAVYLYSAKEWNIKQNGKKVPFRKADHKPFLYKYQLSIESSKIPKDGWTQIELKVSRLMANFWEGDKINDSYKISGGVLLELATSQGVYSQKLPISLTIDSLPF